MPIPFELFGLKDSIFDDIGGYIEGDVFGIVGLGHFFITVGLTVILVNLGRAIKEPDDGNANAAVRP